MKEKENNIVDETSQNKNDSKGFTSKEMIQLGQWLNEGIEKVLNEEQPKVH